MENNYGEKLILLPDLQIMKLPWKNQTKVEAGAMINIVLSKKNDQKPHRMEVAINWCAYRLLEW